MDKRKLSSGLAEMQLGKDMTKDELKALQLVLQKWEAKGFDLNHFLKNEEYLRQLEEIKTDNKKAKTPDEIDHMSAQDFINMEHQSFLSGIQTENSFLKNTESTPLTRLQVSVSESTHHLLSCWSIAEGQPITSCLRLALEKGLRQMKKDGELPEAACESYEDQCRKRIIFAELKNAMTIGALEIFKSNKEFSN